jgi:hypothetical protein
MTEYLSIYLSIYLSLNLPHVSEEEKSEKPLASSSMMKDLKVCSTLENCRLEM